MAQTVTPKRRSPFRWVRLVLFLCCFGVGGYQGLAHPETPVPGGWNPTQPLRITDPVGPLTRWKMRVALASNQACLAVLQEGPVHYTAMPDLVESAQCGISGRVDLRGVGASTLAPVQTRCAIALRLAMWERHALQPAAQAHFGQGLRGIKHRHSYNCRKIRTPGGSSNRMSTHATANAIDIAGFTLQDGTYVPLLGNWAGEGAKAQFMRAARDSACVWFRTVLGPDFNSLHNAHFHIQNIGWGTCR